MTEVRPAAPRGAAPHPRESPLATCARRFAVEEYAESSGIALLE
jgi:hypothetical protein